MQSKLVMCIGIIIIGLVSLVSGLFLWKIPAENRVDGSKRKRSAIVKEYGISENQTLRILRKDNVQVILVCDKESMEVEQIITRQEM